MTFPTSIASDYAIFDGTETVTFRRVVDGAVAASVSVQNALRQPISRNAAQLTAAGLSLEPSDVTIGLWVSRLGGERPKPGDLIEDASGVVYTILAANNATLQTRYDCICRERRV